MSVAPTFSICIPTYDMGGKGGEYLAYSLERLTRQTYQSFEVVVSDQSDTDGVIQACKQYSDQLTIRRFAFHKGPRQASANTNHAMHYARGVILKILFQDDYLCDDNALMIMARAMESREHKWLLCGSGVTRDGETLTKPMVPALNSNIHLGKNTVSSPSVLALEAGHDLKFDEDLIWLMDGEFYKRCFDTLGPPKIVPDALVANRLHEGQVSEGVSKELRRKELIHVRKKFYPEETLGNRLHYYKQRLKAR